MTAHAFAAFIMHQVVARRRGAALRVKLWFNLPQKVALHVMCALFRAVNIKHVRNGQRTPLSDVRRLSESLRSAFPAGRLRFRPVSIYSSTRRQKDRYESNCTAVVSACFAAAETIYRSAQTSLLAHSPIEIDARWKSGLDLVIENRDTITCAGTNRLSHLESAQL
jgi:hypothetical protein